MKDKIWFSSRELALLGKQQVAGLPTTMPGCTGRSQREEWLSREVKGGGGPGGVLTEYQPPAEVLALIQPFLEANPDFFEKGKSRKGGFHIPARSQEEAAASRRHTQALFEADRQQIERERRESFGDAPAAFEALLKRLGEATQATVRISKQFDFPLPTEWTSLIQELMAMHGLGEAGAKRVIDELLKAQARK
ncbi:MAG: hypothetical protein Q8K43_10525 [Sulfurimicrobium sp.]|nr:hypothetical protein [Gallionella sp.]MDP1898310.1 hypothetical protein [Sulfurimicrobium sp.]